MRRSVSSCRTSRQRSATPTQRSPLRATPCRSNPSNAAPLEQLASVFADLGDAARLTSAADELIGRFPERNDGQYYRAAAMFLDGRAPDAERATHILLSAGSTALQGAQPARGDLRLSWRRRVRPEIVHAIARRESSRPFRVREPWKAEPRGWQFCGSCRIFRRGADHGPYRRDGNARNCRRARAAAGR